MVVEVEEELVEEGRVGKAGFPLRRFANFASSAKILRSVELFSESAACFLDDREPTLQRLLCP